MKHFIPLTLVLFCALFNVSCTDHKEKDFNQQKFSVELIDTNGKTIKKWENCCHYATGRYNTGEDDGSITFYDSKETRITVAGTYIKTEE